MTTEDTNQNPKDSSKKGLFIGFIIILLGINAYQFYLSTENQKVIAEKVVIIEEKTNKNAELVASIDSAQAVIAQQKQDYERLGIEKTAQLDSLYAELEKQKRAVRANAGYKVKLVKVQKELDEIKSLLSENGGEIEKYKAQAEAMLADNTKLKEEKNKLSDSINQITVKTSALEQKVKLASQLVAINVKTTVINKKSKELDEPIYKAKNIDKLNVKFNYADNKVSDVGGRVIYLRIIEPDGATLSDPASGSGNFNFEGQEISYTATQEHLFDNSQKPIAFLFSKPGGGYKPGKYLVEIYTDGHKSGEGSFLVK